MKKNYYAFTLAEVLITLVIIGVIAAITIPVLVHKIENDELETQFKKTYSEVNQATNSLIDDNGGSLANVFGNSNDMMNVYSKVLKFTKKCPASVDVGGCWHVGAAGWKKMDGSDGWESEDDNARAIMADGAMISFIFGDGGCTYGGDMCGNVKIDVNGFKGPNMMGRDIFELAIHEKKLLPSLYDSDLSQSCNKNNNYAGLAGIGCAAKMLNGGHVDY